MNNLLMNLLLAFCLGGIANVALVLFNNNKVLVLPRKSKRPQGIKLGFIADFLIGGIAGSAAVTFLGKVKEDDIVAIIGMSLMGGLNAGTIMISKQLDLERQKTSNLSDIIDRTNK